MGAGLFDDRAPFGDFAGDIVTQRFRRSAAGLHVEYVELMANLNLPNPKLMDVVLPANMHVGLHQDDLAKQGLSFTAREAIESLGRPNILLVDLRSAGVNRAVVQAGPI